MSKDIVMEANSIMHKLIRHYARKQRRAFVVSESLGVSSGRERLNNHTAAAAAVNYNNSDNVSQTSSVDDLMSPLSGQTLAKLAETPKERIPNKGDHHEKLQDRTGRTSSTRGRGAPRKTSGPRMV